MVLVQMRFEFVRKGESDAAKGSPDLWPDERVRQGRHAPVRQAERDREAETVSNAIAPAVSSPDCRLLPAA